MKNIFLIIFLTVTTMNAQKWTTPTIEGYGRIHTFDSVAAHPVAKEEYKVLFHIISDKEREGVNAALWKMARTINLLEASGVPKENIFVGAVISGEATPIVLTDMLYQKRLDKPNPNLDLMKKLTDYGAFIHICGQAAVEHDVDPKTDLNPYVHLTLSALTDVLIYEKEGYILME